MSAWKRLDQSSCIPLSHQRESGRWASYRPSSTEAGIRKLEMSDLLKVMQRLNGRAKNTVQDSQLPASSIAWITLPPRNIRDLIFSPLLSTETEQSTLLLPQTRLWLSRASCHFLPSPLLHSKNRHKCQPACLFPIF